MPNSSLPTPEPVYILITQSVESKHADAEVYPESELQKTIEDHDPAREKILAQIKLFPGFTDQYFDAEQYREAYEILRRLDDLCGDIPFQQLLTAVATAVYRHCQAPNGSP